MGHRRIEKKRKKEKRGEKEGHENEKEKNMEKKKVAATDFWERMGIPYEYPIFLPSLPSITNLKYFPNKMSYTSYLIQ